MSQHFLQSSYREKLIEHLFVGELLKYSWAFRSCSLAIAKPEVDNGGYDIIAEEGSVVRHIQLKTAHRGASAKSQKIHRALCDKPAGCVVWIQFDEATLELGPYLFFGGGPQERLALDGFKVAKHAKANALGVKAERQNIRVVPRTRFRKKDTIEALYAELFAGV
jgi:hypothetical protein